LAKFTTQDLVEAELLFMEDLGKRFDGEWLGDNAGNCETFSIEETDKVTQIVTESDGKFLRKLTVTLGSGK